ncbi:MAG: class I poly(R)-hydroxyalkanoic acid synthase [Hyphomicrobiales bacterium]|nr:class I poly(R)-hydroxyalkanoic acid synthase [Hyphomicrobiales bacterium]
MAKRSDNNPKSPIKSPARDAPTDSRAKSPGPSSTDAAPANGDQKPARERALRAAKPPARTSPAPAKWVSPLSSSTRQNKSQPPAPPVHSPPQTAAEAKPASEPRRADPRPPALNKELAAAATEPREAAPPVGAASPPHPSAERAPPAAAASEPPSPAASFSPPGRTAAKASPATPTEAPAQYPLPNFEALANNVANAIEQAGKAMAAYMRPRETGEIKPTFADDVGEMMRSLGRVAEFYMSDPKRAFEAQTALTTQFISLWASTLQRFQGGFAAPVVEPDRSDKRFSHADWRDNPFFDFIKQAYVLTTRWADDLVRRADELDPHTRHKAQFYLRQVAAALSPSNFVGTNPELLRATLEESGENLVRGLKMMAEDIEAGQGNLRIRQVDARAFQLGVNLATTPGKVIFRNELIELMQYEPTTAEVFKRPLLIVPPWINKFYILDLNAEKSFIRWAVAQGVTVFVISWVNPDERLADKDFEAYMREGVLAALDCVEQATGEREATAIGYCVGGTLLAATLGYMAAVGDGRIASVTFFTALVDFTDAGDLQVFVDAEQLKAVEEKMAGRGYLEGSHMANAFNMLRPNDLIWSYYVNNYLKGKEPMPFDLLVWNSDSTRMPAANHNFYLRHCYYQNDLSNARVVLGGKTIDLKKVTIPIYELATKEDHIAPARGVFRSAQCFGGPVRFVLAGSGHIAGVVNPAGKPKYQYWTDGPPASDFDSWLKAAEETPGSWWPDWIRWIAAQAPEKVPARKPGDGKLKPIGDAPGEYVRMKA